MPKMPLTTNDPILSEAARIKRLLNTEKHDRWGFAIYRCTYGDDAAWDRFKNIVTTRARKEIQDSDTSEILDTLDWKFFDDREIFDKATVAFLREHFNQWKCDNWQHEQPRASFPRAPRYECFIRVDREALDSVLDAPDSQDATPGARYSGWVHFVDAKWTSELDDVDSETEEIDMPYLDFEPLEGCREEDVGWMKVPAARINTELYSLLEDYQIWDDLYRRPPEMAII